MEKMFTLADALRDGATPDEVMEGFKKALEAAQDEVAAEKKAKEAEAAKTAANKRKSEKQVKLDKTRNEAVDAIIAYLSELFEDPTPAEIVEALREAAEAIENDFKAKLPIMRMMRDIAKMDDNKNNIDKCKCGSSRKDDNYADEVIQRFIKSLH